MSEAQHPGPAAWSGMEEALGYGEQLLRGDTVRLRASTDEELTVLEHWWNEPAVAMFNARAVRPRPPGLRIDHLRTWVANEDGALGTGFSVITLAGEEFAGHVGLFAADPKERVATFGIALGPPFWGRGLGTDATRVMVRYGFLELGLHRIELRVWAFNQRAVAAYASAGFQVEGRLREVVFHDGRWHDELLMAQLDRDWRANHPR
jgi:RimJ/RimL family protein N-acetyltransferase